MPRREDCAGILKRLSVNELVAEIRAKKESVGVAAIGGAFELVDQNNKPFTDKDLHGLHSLLYFGFTNCPDICPDELVKLAAAIDDVGEDILYRRASGSSLVKRSPSHAL